jgi:hypothetical protein
MLVAALVKPVCSTVKRLLDRTAKRPKRLSHVYVFWVRWKTFLSRAWCWVSGKNPQTPKINVIVNSKTTSLTD